MSENRTVGCELGAAGGSRTPTPLTAYGFGPCASACSATAASLGAAERHRTSTWSPTRASEARPSAISSTTAKPGADERTRTSTWLPTQRSERCSSASSDTSAGRTWYREGDSDPHAPCGVLGSKPSASACSAIPANLGAVGGNRTPTPLRAQGSQPCSSAYSDTTADLGTGRGNRTPMAFEGPGVLSALRLPFRQPGQSHPGTAQWFPCPETWCQRQDLDLRSPQGAADLQSAGISLSPTLAKNPIKRKRRPRQPPRLARFCWPLTRPSHRTTRGSY